MEMVGKVSCLVVLCMAVVVAVAPHAEAISCGQVSGSLAPCLNYLRKGGVIPKVCCDGVTSLANNARTTPDRQTACTCMKQLATSVGGINLSNAAGLPGKCKVNIPYKISPSVDCSRVK